MSKKKFIYLAAAFLYMSSTAFADVNSSSSTGEESSVNNNEQIQNKLDSQLLKDSLKKDLNSLGKKYNLSNSKIADLYNDTVIGDDSDDEESNDKADFFEKERMKEIPLKDVDALAQINSSHGDNKTAYRLHVNFDIYRFSGDREEIKNAIKALEGTGSDKEFKDSVATFNSITPIMDKVYLDALLNEEGYVTAPAYIENIKSRSLFDAASKSLTTKPYGNALYLTSPINGDNKILLGFHDNPCEFIDGADPVCMNSDLIIPFEIQDLGYAVGEYNDTTRTQIFIRYKSSKLPTY